MFQTLQPQTIRINKTSFPATRRKLHASNFEPRPNTDSHTLNIQSQFSTIRSPTGNHFVTLDLAEIQLRKSFQKQLSPFLKQRIRNSLSQNNQNKYFQSGQRRLSRLQNPQFYFKQERNFKQARKTKDSKFFNQTFQSLKFQQPLNIKQMKMTSFLSKSPPAHKDLAPEMISSSLIINTKQKLNRLVSLKHEQQEEFLQLKKSIRSRCTNKNNLKNFHLRRKSIIDPKSDYKLPLMEEETWDRQWREDLNKQTNRYRNRLFNKHKRDMSMKINILQNFDNFTIEV